MKCPNCGSSDTQKPGVMSARWKMGEQFCRDCDYQGDWLEFVENRSPERRKKIIEVTDLILGPLKAVTR